MQITVVKDIVNCIGKTFYSPTEFVKYEINLIQFFLLLYLIHAAFTLNFISLELLYCLLNASLRPYSALLHYSAKALPNLYFTATLHDQLASWIKYNTK